MKRRDFISMSSVAALGLVAGCMDDSTPSTTPSQTQTTTVNNGSDQEPPSGNDVPQNMTDISKFAFNKHNKNARTKPYMLEMAASNETPDRKSTQQSTFRYDGDSKSYFGLEFTSPEASGTVEQFSTGGLLFIRHNPDDGEIQYNKESIREQVFLVTGLKQIEQLSQSDVTVGDPEQQEIFVYRYPIESHPQYETVNGFIELDVQTGLLKELQFEGKGQGKHYSLSLKFSYGGVSVDAPAWVKDMDSNTTTDSS